MAEKATEEVKKALCFLAFDLNEKKQHLKPSERAFTMLRMVAQRTKDKPQNPEKAGSWKRGAQIAMDLSDAEINHVEIVKMPPNFDGVEVPVTVLNPAGVIIVWPEGTWDQLDSYWAKWLKDEVDKGGATNASALDIHLTHQWIKEHVISVPITTETGVRIGCTPEAIAALKAPPTQTAPAV